MSSVVFRDGSRDVPEYMADMLKSVEVYKLTYKEAMAEVNRRMETEVIRREMNRSITDHFRTRR